MEKKPKKPPWNRLSACSNEIHNQRKLEDQCHRGLCRLDTRTGTENLLNSFLPLQGKSWCSPTSLWYLHTLVWVTNLVTSWAEVHLHSQGYQSTPYCHWQWAGTLPNFISFYPSEANPGMYIVSTDFITGGTLFWVFNIRIVSMGFSQNTGLQQWAQTRQVLHPQESMSSAHQYQSSFSVAEFTSKFPVMLIVKIRPNKKGNVGKISPECVLWLSFLLLHEEN